MKIISDEEKVENDEKVEQRSENNEEKLKTLARSQQGKKVWP